MGIDLASRCRKHCPPLVDFPALVDFWCQEQSTLIQAGIIGLELEVNHELTKAEDFSKRQRSPRIVSSFHMSPEVSTASGWRHFDTVRSSFLQLPGESEISKIMKAWDFDHSHVSNIQTPLIETHCVQFCNWL